MPEVVSAPGRAGPESDVVARRVVETLSKSTEPLRVAEIARLVGVSRPECRRALERMQKLGFAEYHVRSKEWDIGVDVLRIASAYLQHRPLHRIGRALLPDAARRTGRTAHIAILDGADVVYLDEEHPPEDGTGLATEFGTRRPAILTAVGQAMLADASDAEIDRLVAGGPDTLDASRTAAVLASIDRCRVQGFATESGLTTPGVACLASPVRDGNGRTIASLGVTFVSAQSTPEGVEATAATVVELALRFSALLGWQAPAPQQTEARR